ncbi:hypothetical protein CXB51_005145 [Gossypium anomalum]|uniref:DUF7745 domain-containing protein n=1 Tax=Gossypium anomalum TaxID=47600 RepID=A0A8J5Z2B8_9ROSI|nr:hypothetical protein CXB51_005145 [Gossypium anomalum]
MENGLLDRVEGNANVHRWSEQAQLEKEDSIAEGYISKLSNYTRISVTQNNLQELKEIRNQWGNETKQLFYSNYGDLPYLLDIQFWNPAYSCFTFGQVDLVPTVEEYTALLRCPKFQMDRIYSRAASVPTFSKKLMTITGMSEQWITSRIKEKAETFRSLGTCRKAGAGRKIDVPEKNWIALLQNFQVKDVEWRAPWIIPGEILYRCGRFNWVPLLGIWGAIGYAPLLVLRQFGLRQFVPVTHGLAQSEFMYKGADYKKKFGEISNAWNKTCQLKGIAISPATTPEYIEWRGRRVNDNIPKPNVERARSVEEYLRVMPSELEIMRQEFERKNLELEKKITKLEEEKMYLSLDVGVQKKERARVGGSSDQLQKEVQEGRTEYWERKFQEMQSQNLALEEENKGLKSKVTELGRSLRWHRSHDSTVELKELKSKVDDLEVALHDGELRVEQLKAQEEYLKGELHQARGQVEERDYVIGEAIAQIREVAEYVQDLAIRADVLSLMYSLSSDVGRELALLLDRVKALGLRVKAYL